MNYYNEIDPKAAAWLSELIAEGHIPPGHVDQRSICDVSANDVSGYAQCHWFAGIGGWSLALRLAGVPDDFPIDTGSCPCQPFSGAGKGEGQADPRDLWPHMFRITRERCPQFVIGEQVARAVGFGWLDGVSADLEAERYAVGSIVLGAHSVGAPHIRQRLYWGGRRLADTGHELPGRRARSSEAESRRPCDQSPGRGPSSGLGDAIGIGCEGERWSWQDRTAQPSRPWDAYDLLSCTDGKARRVESGTFPLAHGIPGRVGLLQGYGNAIVPQVAAEFIKAFLNI